MTLIRIRRWGAWLASGAAGALILLILRIHGASLPGGPKPLEEESLSEQLLTYTEADTVHRGDTLSGLLLRNRVDVLQIQEILREIRTRNYFSPRALRRGQVLEFTRDEWANLVRLTIRLSPEEIFVFETGADSLRSFAQAVDSEMRVRKLSGTVKSTLEEALLTAGGDYGLSIKLADILACDIDFCTEVRKGDRFSLLVEERYVDGTFLSHGEILYGWYEGEEASGSCVYFRPTGGKGGYYDAEGKSLQRTFLKSPLNYRRISSHFSKKRFHPILKRWRPHHGVDYAAAEGTPVVAVADGTIEYAGWKGGYGRYVKIRHNRGYATCYGHLRNVASGVRGGARIKQGDRVGTVGKTGLATGPHLHYEVIENGRSVNPLALKTYPAEPIGSAQLPDFQRLVAEMQAADGDMIAGAVLSPNAWQDLLAQNSASDLPSGPN
ncbi:MAG: hypothetical protein FJY88_03725 [Candidatus Eisenbacteria bacterium]|nr:hypothetical protein [Candidatus Eisenbacteria bacterium]